MWTYVLDTRKYTDINTDLVIYTYKNPLLKKNYNKVEEIHWLFCQNMYMHYTNKVNIIILMGNEGDYQHGMVGSTGNNHIK